MPLSIFKGEEEKGVVVIHGVFCPVVDIHLSEGGLLLRADITDALPIKHGDVMTIFGPDSELVLRAKFREEDVPKPDGLLDPRDRWILNYKLSVDDKTADSWRDDDGNKDGTSDSDPEPAGEPV